MCHGDGKGPDGADLRVKSFDGTPLAVYVTLPPAPASGTDGNYPLVIQSHGWGAPPSGPDDAQYGGPDGACNGRRMGMPSVQLAARGWGNSCGALNSRFLDPEGCANGYVRRADFRYEIRDAQYVAGLLVDEGIADRNRIGAQGESYGGGTSLALATLNDRVMNADGTLSPWTSRGGIPLHFAAAAPFAGWSDRSALAPNGRWLDTQNSRERISPCRSAYRRCRSVGACSWSAPAEPIYPPPGAEPDMMMGFAITTAGEPYDRPLLESMLKDEGQFHSSYDLLAGTYGTAQRAPAPLFFGHGFTDDVFWADQVLVYYNLMRSQYPSVPVEVLFGDIGHQRAQQQAGRPGADAHPHPGVLRLTTSRAPGLSPRWVSLRSLRPARPARPPAVRTPPPPGRSSTPAWSVSTPNRPGRCFPPAAIPRFPRRSTRFTAATLVRPCPRPMRVRRSRPIDCRPPPARDIHCSDRRR